MEFTPVSRRGSDPVGHHPGVELQEERLQLAQPTPALLLLLLAAAALFVHALILALLLLLVLVHPRHPGAAVPAGVGPGVVGREVDGHGGAVVVGQPGQQLLHHVGPVLRQVAALARVGRDVEQPDVLVGGVLAVGQDVSLQVPPAARQGGQNLGPPDLKNKSVSQSINQSASQPFVQH